MILNKVQVMKFLPHRDPFLFIDEVCQITYPFSQEFEKKNQKPEMKDIIGGEVHCRYHNPASHPIYAGHFPDHPILPGVVQVEMMAQASSFLLLKVQNRPLDEIKIDVALLGVDGARFKKPITPGMVLDVHAKLTKVRSFVMSYDCHINCNDELISACSILASIKFL